MLTRILFFLPFGKRKRNGRVVCADWGERGTEEKMSLQAATASYIFCVHGEMSERLKEHDWKSCVR